MMPVLIERDEAARALGVDPETVDRLVANGRLRPVRLFDGDADRFRPEDIVDLLEPKPAGGPMALSSTAIRPLRWELDAEQVAALAELDRILEAYLPADSDGARAAAVAGMTAETQVRVVELWAKLPGFPSVPPEFHYSGPAAWRPAPRRGSDRG